MADSITFDSVVQAYKYYQNNAQTTVYIAGPMRGIPHDNFPAFDAARDMFIKRGYTVHSPADMARQLDHPSLADMARIVDTTIDDTVHIVKYMMRDFEAIEKCTAIALLPGWSSSWGAMMEYQLATHLKLRILDATTGEPYDFTPKNRTRLLALHTNMCSEAKSLMVRKNNDYTGKAGDDPYANFRRVEALGICSPEQGFLVRIADKLSRISTFVADGKLLVADENVHDTLIDLINYAILLAGYIDSERNHHGS